VRRQGSIGLLAFACFVIGLVEAMSAVAQEPRSASPRVAVRPAPTPTRAVGFLSSVRPGEHPLMGALRWAKAELPNVARIRDYSAYLQKRELIDGKLNDPETIFLKIRHRPFSVYMRFEGPPAFKGREVIYVEGKNDGKLLAHATGVQGLVGTLSLPPKGMLAMSGQRYPLTEIGMLNLTKRLVEVAEQDVKYGECQVKYYTSDKGIRVNKRPCTCIQVEHPVPRRNFLFHRAYIFVDDQLSLPVRYQSFDWPKKPGDKPQLLEEYTYYNIRLNNGFTDKDFDVDNEQYNF